eukprot:Skav211197  [mRNA]  locus=scaffold2111:100173:100448:- [translate_table: standard]
MSTACGVGLTIPANTLSCGSQVNGFTFGRSNVVGRLPGDSVYKFCPDGTVEAKISTCGSSFDTWLYVPQLKLGKAASTVRVPCALVFLSIS